MSRSFWHNFYYENREVEVVEELKKILTANNVEFEENETFGAKRIDIKATLPRCEKFWREAYNAQREEKGFFLRTRQVAEYEVWVPASYANNLRDAAAFALKKTATCNADFLKEQYCEVAFGRKNGLGTSKDYFSDGELDFISDDPVYEDEEKNDE